MKRIITFSVLLLVAQATVNAQIQAGNVMAGADIGRFNLSLDKGGLFSMSLNPKAAWFIRDGVAVGGYLSFGLATAKGAGTGIDYGVGALARYYINDQKLNDFVGRSRFFFEGTAGIQGDNPAVGDNTNGLGLGIGPGWTYFITPNIGLEALLKYQGIIGFGSKPTSNNLALGVGFQIYLPNSRVKSIQRDLQKN